MTLSLIKTKVQNNYVELVLDSATKTFTHVNWLFIAYSVLKSIKQFHYSFDVEVPICTVVTLTSTQHSLVNTIILQGFYFLTKSLVFFPRIYILASCDYCLDS